MKPLLIVAGLGKGVGLGAASAKLFARSGGYDIALVSRGADTLRDLSQDIRDLGGRAEAFPLKSYSPSDIQTAMSSVWSTFSGPEHVFRAAIWNGAYPIFKPFLSTTPEEVHQSLAVNTEAAFAFSRECILKFRENDSLEEETKKKGTLIFTGATAATRGNVMTSAFAAAKAANRSLSQSLAKEFGPEGIHVAHAVIDGRIMSETPDSASGLNPESIAQAYYNLVQQEKSACTWELDLRPGDERW